MVYWNMKISLVFAFLFLPLSAFAQSVLINEIAWPVNVAYATNGLKMGTVIINEVAWMGSPVGGIDPKQWWRYEWLELYNAEPQDVSLIGWNVVLYKGEGMYFSILLEGSIPSQGYFLIGASDKISGVDVNYSNLGGKFLNTGQRIVVSNASGAVVDEVDATSGWPGGDNKTKQTMERTNQGWQTSREPGGTPKAPNSEGMIVAPQDQTKSRLVNSDETEKDLSGSLPLQSLPVQSFQSRVPIINPIALLAGLLALGFSGVLLLVKRSLALRQRSGQASRQERRQS